MTTENAESVWIYHEKQEALLCGQHALNNLLQRPAFSAAELSQIAQQLDALELEYMAQNNEGGVRSPDYVRRVQEGSSNVDEAGNFSIQVLKAALQDPKYGLVLDHLSDKVLEGKDVTEMQGFICHKSDHWFAIRNIGGRFWNLNSTADRPEAVSHFALATEMKETKKLGYTIFAIPSGLPPVGQSKLAGGNWHKMSDLLKGKSTQSDPWQKMQGRGMRLDGGSSSGSGVSPMAIDGLTEDEQIALAMQQSMEPTPAPIARNVTEEFSIPDEPARGEKATCRIQLRLLDGSRMVRSFRTSDPVGGIYALVGSKGDGRAFSLKAGFPPKDLVESKSKPIGECGLAGESIQARYI